MTDQGKMIFSCFLCKKWFVTEWNHRWNEISPWNENRLVTLNWGRGRCGLGIRWIKCGWGGTPGAGGVPGCPWYGEWPGWGCPIGGRMCIGWAPGCIPGGMPIGWPAGRPGIWGRGIGLAGPGVICWASIDLFVISCLTSESNLGL